MTRAEEFPLPESVLPAKLRALLEPITVENAHRKVEVAASFEHDIYGPGREALHMLMVAVPERKAAQLGVLREASSGIVDNPIRETEAKGALRKYDLTASGYDPIVMTWGSGLFFAYNLSEKVWMSLGLSPRCLGNQNQRVVYDDPAAPEFAVAEGEISSAYHFTASRNVSWTMRNDYLRRYLWMRGTVGVRVFFYMALLDDTAAVRAIMKGEAHHRDEQKGNWFVLDIREWKQKLLLQVWASVPAVSSKLCPQPNIHRLIWPGDDGPMTEEHVGDASARIQHVYLKDTFLQRYEQNAIYGTVPVRTPDGVWLCSPSYGGQWSFSGCHRVGRNLIKTDIYELYKGVPDREILHAYEYAVAGGDIPQASLDEEHIVAKAQRLLDQLLSLGDNLSALGDLMGLPHKAAAELVGFARKEVAANGWLHYPTLCRLGQVAPLDMTQQAFLSRCKTLHEILQKVPNAYLKALLRTSGCAPDDLKGLGSIQLFQGLSNILDELDRSQDDATAFSGAAVAINWRARSDAVAALFVNNELRIADAHEGAGDWLLSLERLGFDTAQVNDGYGRALDFVLDAVIDVLDALNTKLTALLSR
jgi:hypothetical protein